MEGGKGINGGELRRIHIIYFLSRLGHAEHPHLIRVHHLTRNGVYLRDVKRWLAEVRGRDMPEAFSWSYKRRYKSGYVWQDLLDDDLITPISDNEYVLKGSEILPTFDEKEVGMLRNIDDEPAAVEVGDQEQQKPSFFPKDEIQNPTPRYSEPQNGTSQLYQESPVYPYASASERSTLTDDSMNHELEDANYNNNNNNIKPTLTQNSKNYSTSSPSFYSGLLNKKKSNSNNNKKTENKDIQKTATRILPSSSSPKSSSQFAKGNSCSNGASNILRNLMKCGAADTNDAAVVNINAVKTCLSQSIDLPVSDTNSNSRDRDSALKMICRGGNQLGGSARIFGSTWNNQQQYGARKSFDGTNTTASKKKNEFASPKPVSSAYKPVGGPTCTQCGKLFQPEKMHKHMKSCKGMKALSKTTRAVSFEKTAPQRSMNFSPRPHESTSTCSLTN